LPRRKGQDARKDEGEVVANVAEPLRPLLVPIDSVQPDERNARIHPPRNIQVLKRSLEAYGQRKPIVVNKKTSTIEAGNGLWQAARELGWTHIAVVFVEDDPNTALGYSIVDNQAALLADWDFPKLSELLHELREADFDLDLTGFSETELEVFSAFPAFDEAISEESPPEGDLETGGSGPEPAWIVRLRFETKEAAEAWLTENGFGVRFTGKTRSVTIPMG